MQKTQGLERLVHVLGVFAFTWLTAYSDYQIVSPVKAIPEFLTVTLVC